MSNETLEIAFELTDEDVVAPAQWQYLNELPMRGGLIAGVVGLVLSYAFGFGGLSEWYGPNWRPMLETFGRVALGGFGALSVVLGGIFAAPFWFSRWLADRVGRPPSPVQMRISESSVVVDTEMRHSEIDWNFFDRVVDWDDYFLLQHANQSRNWTVVPKRAFASPDEQRRFAALASENSALQTG